MNWDVKGEKGRKGEKKGDGEKDTFSVTRRKTVMICIAKRPTFELHKEAGGAVVMPELLISLSFNSCLHIWFISSFPSFLIFFFLFILISLF